MNDVQSCANPPLQREVGNKLWHQIAQALELEISACRLKGRLPSETELATHFRVNRHTVRQAIRALAERGVVTVLQGRGTFVSEGLRTITGRSGPPLAQGLDLSPAMVLQSTEVEPLPAEIAQALAVPPGSSGLRFNFLQFDTAHRSPLAIITRYFPLPRFAGLELSSNPTSDAALLLTQYGLRVYRRQLSRISARLSGREDARQLQVPTSHPVLYTESIYVDEHAQPVEYRICQLSGSAIELHVPAGDSGYA